MRWKLIILASLVVSTVTAGAWFALANFVFRTPLFLRDNWFYLQAFALVVVINAVSIFVYRRTARNRKTQAFLASILTLVLLIAFLFVLQQLPLYPKP